MAIYHFKAEVIKRSDGRSALAAAAYRAGIVLEDERTGQTHDYSRKGGIVSSEIMAPDDAPDWMRDRAQLWNAVELAEKRKDSQLAREFVAALPDELDKFERRELVRGFVAEQLVDRGMVADVNIHLPDRRGDQRNHHVHIQVTMRDLTGAGFGNKQRAWNSEEQFLTWREAWARHTNRALERGEQARGLEAGTFGRVDHRSLEEQGIEREATLHLGPQATALERAGIETRLGDHNREVAARAAELAALKQERQRIEAEIIALEAERNRRRVAELAAEIPYMAPVAAEIARVAAGQPGDGSPLAQRIDRLAEAAPAPAAPTPERVAAWQGMVAAQGHGIEPLPDPSAFGPRFWELAAEHLAQETARQEQTEQAQIREASRTAAAADRSEDAALRDLFNAAVGEHPAIKKAVDRMQGQRRHERGEDSQARGLLWLDQTVRGLERIGTKAADMFGRVAERLGDLLCDLFAPDPRSRLLSPEDRAERQALEARLDAAQELRDFRDREQRQRLASALASLDHDRQRQQEQSLERQRTRSRGPK